MTAQGVPAGVKAAFATTLDEMWAELLATEIRGRALRTAELTDLRTTAGAVHVARDSDLRRHLMVPLPGVVKERVVLATKGVSLTVRNLVLGGSPIAFLDLACLRPDLESVFTRLTADACEALAANPPDPAVAVTKVVEQWRELLDAGGDTWTRSKCAGLFAELSVLSRLLRLSPSAVETWHGPMGAAQDFRALGQAVEVKATLGSEGRVIRIHQADQLEEPAGGELHLIWMRVTEDGSGGTTLRALVEEVRAVCTDLATLQDRLDRLVFPITHGGPVDDLKFVSTEERCYRVDGQFPRIVPASFAGGAVPAGVTAVAYSVDLDVVTTALRRDTEPVLDSLVGHV